jgi:hypothetical protein
MGTVGQGSPTLGIGGRRIEEPIRESESRAAEQVDVVAREKQAVRETRARKRLLKDGDGGRAEEGVGPR